MNNSVEAYSDIAVTTEVMSATPHRQIQMLYEKCLQHLAAAKTHVLNADTVKKSQSISKANDIVHYLRTCLNFKYEEARDLSNLLDSIYIFIEKLSLINYLGHLTGLKTAFRE